jgi:2-hydroxy-3-oxopropionate reductase
MSTHIAFIGLGVMGRPMARRLLGAGFSLAVFNRSRPPIDELVSDGARGAASLPEAVEGAAVVITMLPDTPDVEAVMAGAQGVLAHAAAGALLIDMSTIAPGAAQALAAKAEAMGRRLLDAPVSGGDVGAKAGTLSIMVGGASEDFARARPIFEAMGKTITHCGPAGSGQLVKACNQIVVGTVIEAVSEAILLAERAGLDPAVMIQVLQGGLAQTRVMELKGPKMVSRAFTPGFRAALHLKDLRIVAAEAGRLGLVLPVAAQVQTFLADLVERGDGALDHSAMLMAVERLSTSGGR